AYLMSGGATIAKGPAECAKLAPKIFGPMRLATSTIFADQKKTKWFLRQKSGERKQILAEILNLQYLENIYKAIAARAAKVEINLAGTRVDILADEARAAEITELRSQLDILRIAAAAIDVGSARESERLAIVALEQARAGAVDLERLKEGLYAANRERDSIDGQITAASRNRDALILSATSRKASIAKVLDQTPESVAESFVERRRQTEGRIKGWERTIAEEPKITAAAEQANRYRKEYAELQRAERAWKELQIEVTRAEGALQTANAAYKGARSRIESTRAGWKQQSDQVDLVPCSASDAWIQTNKESTGAELWQTCPLLAIARDARRSLERPASEPEKEKREQAEARKLLQDIAARVKAESPKAFARIPRMQELERLGREAAELAGRAPEVERARTFLAEDTLTLQNLDFERELAIEGLASNQREARELIAAIEAEILSISKDAETRIGQLNADLDSARDRVDTALNAVTTRAEKLLPVEQAEDLLSEARLYREQCEERERAIARSITELETKIAALAPVDQSSLELLKDHAQNLERHISRLNLLADATGKNGVPTLRIDEALPRIGETANQLLAACYGPQFSIKLATLREKAKAGEYSEELDILVYDNGQERMVEAISGGEEVIISEALSLALAIFNHRSAHDRAGALNAGIWENASADYETLFRDETAGALSPENAQAYIKMLRAAMQLGGYSNIIFVSHSPEVWQLADVRLMVDNGTVRPM
ncbi:MAG: hypothetical protein ACREDR_00135, partial [Blastocatellia bacterium]